jgi:hypothetical protein
MDMSCITFIKNKRKVLFSFQNVDRVGFFRYIEFTMYLDITL